MQIYTKQLWNWIMRNAFIPLTNHTNTFWLLRLTNVTGPGKTGLIYTKHTCLYYGTYLLFRMCYPKSVNFIESS